MNNALIRETVEVAGQEPFRLHPTPSPSFYTIGEKLANKRMRRAAIYDLLCAYPSAMSLIIIAALSR